MKESSAGYHFMNLYQNCPWKFYIKYIMGLTPQYVSPALIFGISIHAGVAAFLLGKDYQAEFRKVIHEEKAGYQKEEDYILDSNRGVVLLATWASEVGETLLSDYHVLEAESELEVSLANGYRVTARPDACLVPRGKRGNERAPVYILETKTTRWGRDLVEETLQNADQITTYIWATKKTHPEWNVVGVIPNVMYQNQSKIGIGLGDLIFRGDADLLDYEEQVTGLLVEISQKVLALKGPYNKHALFPRNTSWCGSYNKPCEYISICRQKETTNIPHGFKREDWGERDVLENLPMEEVKHETAFDLGLHPPDNRPSNIRQADAAAQHTLPFNNGERCPTRVLDDVLDQLCHDRDAYGEGAPNSGYPGPNTVGRLHS